MTETMNYYTCIYSPRFSRSGFRAQSLVRANNENEARAIYKSIPKYAVVRSVRLATPDEIAFHLEMKAIKAEELTQKYER